MARKNDVGVFQLANGYWCYRFTMKINGKTIAKRKTVDQYGNKLRTKKDAEKARSQAIIQTTIERSYTFELTRCTVKEVYDEYCQFGRYDRAFQTIRKQDSLWNNHLCSLFGKRFVDDIPAAEINDYLAHLYYNEGLSFKYVESFLKMFYLIFGQAYSRNHLDADKYNRLCKNKDTKIHMPKIRDEDDEDIVSFSKEELAALDDYFLGTNAETAYLLGKYCGLRINESYGLKWSNVDLEAGTLLIDRQSCSYLYN